MKRRSDELEQSDLDWRAVFDDVRQQMEQLSRRIDQVAANHAQEVHSANHEEELPRASAQPPEELSELFRKASRFLVNPLEMIASIINETYAEAGEDAVFADDEALLMIRDLLLEIDTTIIERTRGTNITAKGRRWLLLAESSPSLTTDRDGLQATSSQEG